MNIITKILTGAAAIAILASPASAHGGYPGAYLLAFLHPWVLFIFGYWGISILYRRKVSGSWSRLALPVLSISVLTEGFTLIFANPLDAFPVIVGHSSGPSYFLISFFAAALFIILKACLALLPTEISFAQNPSFAKEQLVIAAISIPVIFFSPFAGLLLLVRSKAPELLPSYDFWIICILLVSWYTYRLRRDLSDRGTYSVIRFRNQTLVAILPLLLFLSVASGYMFFEKETAYHVNPGARGFNRSW